jgi:hypothetical protein
MFSSRKTSRFRFSRETARPRGRRRVALDRVALDRLAGGWPDSVACATLASIFIPYGEFTDKHFETFNIKE